MIQIYHLIFVWLEGCLISVRIFPSTEMLGNCEMFQVLTMDISGFPMPDVNAIGTVHTAIHVQNKI